MKIKHFVYVCLIGLIGITGCRTKQATTQPKQPVKPTVSDPQQLNAKWMLEALNGYPLEKDSFDAEKPNIEIQTQNKMYFGYSGCNRMNGEMSITESTIEFKPGPMTRRACIDGGNIESDFLTALMSSRYYAIKDGKLELKNDQQKVVCKFRKVN